MRARNIKPGFFDNEVLGGLPALTRLLFIGLWCAADREGRLEDRPKRLKKNVLGYDDVTTEDVDRMLEVLSTSGFIIRYEVDGRSYIQVTNFGKHQSPHIKEKASTIPAPPGFGTAGSDADRMLDEVEAEFRRRIDPEPPEGTLEELRRYREVLSPAVCVRAIETACNSGTEKRNWHYIRGILRNLEKRNVRSLAEWERAEKERQRQGGNGNDRQTERREISGIAGFPPADDG